MVSFSHHGYQYTMSSHGDPLVGYLVLDVLYHVVGLGYYGDCHPPLVGYLVLDVLYHVVGLGYYGDGHPPLVGYLVLDVLYHVVGLAPPAHVTLADNLEHEVGRVSLRGVWL